MKGNRKKVRAALCGVLALAGLTAVGTMAAGGAGSRSDPLVTLSYLSETFTGQIMGGVDAELAERNAKLAEGDGDAASLYAVVELTAGESLRGEAGCEVLLRSGTARCAPASAPGLVDATTGDAIAGGTGLQQNHLYLMTDSRDVTADEAAVLLVRGRYMIE